MRVELARQQSFVKLVRVLEILHAQEDTGAENGERQQIHGSLFLVVLSGMNSHHHGVAADKQDHGVQESQVPVQVMMRLNKSFRILDLRDAKAYKQPSEQEDFRGQEQP